MLKSAKIVQLLYAFLLLGINILSLYDSESITNQNYSSYGDPTYHSLFVLIYVLACIGCFYNRRIFWWLAIIMSVLMLGAGILASIIIASFFFTYQETFKTFSNSLFSILLLTGMILLFIVPPLYVYAVVFIKRKELGGTITQSVKQITTENISE